MSNPLQPPEKPFLPYPFLLCLLFALTSGWNLWIQEVRNPDEPRYAVAGRHILEPNPVWVLEEFNGKKLEGPAEQRTVSRWIIPEFNGQPRLIKPIFIYWAYGIGGRIGANFGFGPEFSFRLVTEFFGLLLMLAVYGIGKRLFDERTGFLAGLILLSTYLIQDTYRELLIDPLLTTWFALAWYFFVRVIKHLEAETSTPYFSLLGFYICLGFASLTKGPPLVGVFCAFPMFGYLAWERKWYRAEQGFFKGALWRTGALWGAPLALAIGCCWYYLLWKTDPTGALGIQEYVKKNLVQENLARAAGQVDHNKGIAAVPIVFYIGDVLGHFLPWALLFIPGLCWSYTEWQKNKAEGRALSAQAKMLLLMIFVPFVLMGIAKSKRTLYMMPIYPYLAIWLAYTWREIFFAQTPAYPTLHKVWRYILLSFPVLGFIGCGAFALAQTLGITKYLLVEGSEMLFAGIMAAAIAGLGMKLYQWLLEQRWERASHLAIFIVAIVFFAKEATVRPALIRRDGNTEFYAKLSQIVGNRELAWMGGSGNEVAWYMQRTYRNARRTIELKTEFFDIPNGVLVVRDKEYNNPNSSLIRDTTRVLDRIKSGPDVFYALEADPSRPPDPKVFADEKPAAKEDTD